MIRFDVSPTTVVLEYEPEFGSESWIETKFDEDGEVTISQTFTFIKSDLLKPKRRQDDDVDEGRSYRFKFAARKDGYFRIPGRVLGIETEVLLAEGGIKLERRTFSAERNIRIFGRIAKVKNDGKPIVIGGDRDGSIPIAAFNELLAKFPNSIEVDRYASARIETILGEYFETMTSARENYEVYLNRKSSVQSKALDHDELLQSEINKYVFLRDTIVTWLEDAMNYTEQDWQTMIIKVILLLFPKYVAVLENVTIADFYSAPGTKRNRRIDLCLVDANGNLDVIEIKRPFGDALLSRSLYRDNSVPTKELSGTIMQAEKYLFHLSKWGVEGERALTERHRSQLPSELQIRVTNPKAILLLGRDRGADGKTALSPAQLFDLEVIKRKYANMMDIVTYDDLVRRLNRIIASLSARMVQDLI